MTKKGICLSLIAIFLVSCSTTPNGSSSSGPSSSIPTSTTIIPPTTSTTYTPHIDEDPFPETPMFEIDTSSFTTDAIPVNITAINDFHGQLDEEANDHRVGLAKMATYLLDRRSKGDIVISSGDNYQGSFLCNYDKGQLVSHAFRYIGFDASTIGNHEFDWGIYPIYDNETAMQDRFLGANVFQYPKVNGEWVKSDLGQDYKIINLYEGTEFEVKVGIIGVIGKKQITSITSTIVEDYVFLEPTDIVKSISTKLRNELECDVVIASYHADDPDLSIADIDPTNGQHYVDACFKAHTHAYQSEVVNGVPFIQASAYSRGASNASFYYDKDNKEISLSSSGYTYLAAQDLEADQIVQSVIDAKKLEHADKFTISIGDNTTGHELDVGEMSKFYAKISYDKGRRERDDLNIVGCMFNESRRSLKSGEFTFSHLFETHPFLNDIYVLSVSGYDILREKKYTYGYIDPTVEISNSSYVFYDIMVFNYNGFHISIDSNYNKRYDFFPSAFRQDTPHAPIKLSFNCFDTAVMWLSDAYYIRDNDINGAGFYYRSY